MHILGHCSLDHAFIMIDLQSLIRQQTQSLRSFSILKVIIYLSLSGTN